MLVSSVGQIIFLLHRFLLIRPIRKDEQPHTHRFVCIENELIAAPYFGVQTKSSTRNFVFTWTQMIINEITFDGQTIPKSECGQHYSNNNKGGKEGR